MLGAIKSTVAKFAFDVAAVVAAHKLEHEYVPVTKNHTRSWSICLESDRVLESGEEAVVEHQLNATKFIPECIVGTRSDSDFVLESVLFGNRKQIDTPVLLSSFCGRMAWEDSSRYLTLDSLVAGDKITAKVRNISDKSQKFCMSICGRIEF